MRLSPNAAQPSKLSGLRAASAATSAASAGPIEVALVVSSDKEMKAAGQRQKGEGQGIAQQSCCCCKRRRRVEDLQWPRHVHVAAGVSTGMAG